MGNLNLVPGNLKQGPGNLKLDQLSMINFGMHLVVRAVSGGGGFVHAVGEACRALRGRLGLTVWGSGLLRWDEGILHLGFRVWGSGFSGLGFRV